jgi:hypothetical protein
MRFSFAAAALAGLLLTGFDWVTAQENARRLRPRRLAPGVLTVIPPEKDEGDTFSGPRPLPELLKGIQPDVLNWKPNFSPDTATLKYKAERMIIRRPVWYLEFAFKPLRMIEVDIPLPSGKFVRKPVWYMVYRVKNNGYHLSPKQGHFQLEGAGETAKVTWVDEPDAFGHTDFGAEQVNHTARFMPRFVLVAHDLNPQVNNKKYLDQLVPVAVPRIQQREDPAIKLLDSVQMTTIDIPVSDENIDRSVWGVVTWTDLDPRIDFFSIFIQGLTNAYQFTDDMDAFKFDERLTGRKITPKTLQLCFWRPGDEVEHDEGELRYGMPQFSSEAKMNEALALYGVEKRVDYRWFFP